MFKRIVFALALVLSGACAHAQMPGLNAPIIAEEQAAPEVKALTFQTSAVDNSDSSTYTFSSQPIGTASASRVVIVTIGFSNGSTLLSATIGGVSATTIASSTADAAHRAYLVAAVVPTGTTATVVVNTVAGVNRCGIGVWTATGLPGVTAFDTKSATTGALVNLNTVSGGFAVAYTHPNAGPVTWTNATEAFDDAMEAGAYSSGAQISSTAGGTITITPSHGAAFAASVAASW